MGTDARRGQSGIGREGSTSRVERPSTVPGTHAEYAAEMAKVLRACEIAQSSRTVTLWVGSQLQRGA